MKDYLVKAMAYDGQVRAYATVTTETVNEAQRRHNTWPTASAALGRALTAGAMLGAMLKGEDKLTIKIEGDGPLGVIVVDGNARGEVRGYVTNPQTHLDLNQHGKLDVKNAVGSNGTLYVVKDLGMRDFFTGQVPLVSGELGEDFTYYLLKSEQTPSSVGVGVLVNPDDTVEAAVGFMVQVMPECEEDTIAKIEGQLQAMPSVTELIQRGLTPEEILFEILGEPNVKILETLPVEFKCRCARERIADAIIGLGQDEISDLIETDGRAEAQCHFCNEKYEFSREELEEMKQIAVAKAAE
jgi:molecular chaperone Hsp33